MRSLILELLDLQARGSIWKYGRTNVMTHCSTVAYVTHITAAARSHVCKHQAALITMKRWQASHLVVLAKCTSMLRCLLPLPPRGGAGLASEVSPRLVACLAQFSAHGFTHLAKPSPHCRNYRRQHSKSVRAELLRVLVCIGDMRRRVRVCALGR